MLHFLLGLVISSLFSSTQAAESHRFINVEYNQKMEATKIQVMNILCNGEVPLDSDAQTYYLSNSKESSGHEVFISTGKAAEAISVSLSRKQKVRVFDKFLEIYESRSQLNQTAETENSNIYIPNVISGFSAVSQKDRELYTAFFTRTNSSLNACSENFMNFMQDLLSENIIPIMPLEAIEILKRDPNGPLKSNFYFLTD